jgi:hypothetical protein
MESVPFPSEDHVVSAGQVGWDGDLVIVAVLALVLFPDLEPLHLVVGLVTIVCEVYKAVTNVKCIELKSDALRLSGFKRQPSSLRHFRVISANNGLVIGVTGCRSVLLVCRLWWRSVLASWLRIGHPAVSVNSAC